MVGGGEGVLVESGLKDTSKGAKISDSGRFCYSISILAEGAM